MGILGCFSYEGTGVSYIYDGRMNQATYIETLENCLEPSAYLLVDRSCWWQFQQDNRPCHTAKTVQSWMIDISINLMQWPAKSPDLNRIEHLWAYIDQKMIKQGVW